MILLHVPDIRAQVMSIQYGGGNGIKFPSVKKLQLQRQRQRDFLQVLIQRVAGNGLVELFGVTGTVESVTCSQVSAVMCYVMTMWNEG